MKKKKVLFQSDFSLAKTGFGRNARALLTYLYQTGKYDIVHYCCGMVEDNPDLKKTPWRSIGTLPANAELQHIQRDPQLARSASYGAYRIDKVIEEEKPDIYIAAQDIWGVDFAIEKKWFKEITSAIWTTLDSLPILPTAIEAAKKVDNYWIWSNFATKELNKIGFDKVRTMHGVVDDKYFSRLKEEERKALRQSFGIGMNDFIIGFVFRNQLRKSIPNLLEGFKIFQNRNPESSAKLLLHTCFREGWAIPKLAEEYQINKEDILTTYVCKSCSSFQVQSYRGEEGPCKFCGESNSIVTTDVSCGVTEAQLNQVYNLMDTYCHPFTSGGQEIPIQEAKLTELVTLVTNYSCGKEMCEPEACSLALDWSEYREHGTEFKKASTIPSSIARQLKKVYAMKPEKRQEEGKKAREWTIKNFSPASVGKLMEEFLDNAPLTEFNFELEEEQKDPEAEIPEINDNAEWIKTLYKNILKRNVNSEDDGHQYWMSEIKKGASRISIENYFRNIAAKDNAEKNKKDLEEVLDDEGKSKRILYVMPETERDLFLSTSLFKSLKESYPEHNLYIATNPEYSPMLKGNDYVHKVIPYSPQLEDVFLLEGRGTHEGFFDVVFLPHINTQKIPNFSRNGKDKINYNLKCTT